SLLYALFRRSNWPRMAGCVSSKPRCFYPWDRGCTVSPFLRSLTASSLYGTLIVHTGQGFSIFQHELSYTRSGTPSGHRLQPHPPCVRYPTSISGCSPKVGG